MNKEKLDHKNVRLRLNLIINQNLILILIASNWFWPRGALERFPGCFCEVATVEAALWDSRFLLRPRFSFVRVSFSRLSFKVTWVFTSLLQRLQRQHQRLWQSLRQHPWPYRRYAAWQRSRCKWGRYPWRWLDWASILKCLRCMMWFDCPKTRSVLIPVITYFRV